GRALLDHLFRGSTPTGLANADVNGDGRIDLADATRILAGALTPETPAPDSTLEGDVDGNGVVDRGDGRALFSHLMGGAVPAALANADVNGDGTVNLADVAALLRSLASSPTPPESPPPATPIAPTTSFTRARARQGYAASLGLLGALTRRP
ncbi:MAG: dockerin type I domain-containing protein, partial [Planctomycetota bacterium]